MDVAKGLVAPSGRGALNGTGAMLKYSHDCLSALNIGRCCLAALWICLTTLANRTALPFLGGGYRLKSFIAHC
jgi:hypothetical protein